MDYMYRVSTELRRKEYKNELGWAVVTQEYEQCGLLYYFLKIENACKAAIEFNTSVVPVVYDYDTRKSDHWYEV